MNGIPNELKELKQWHCWTERKDAKGDTQKIPVQVNGQPAKSNDPATWTDYETAAEAAKRFAGLAFELAPPFVGVDLDHCFDDELELTDWAVEILQELQGVAYIEYSPSGYGLKAITQAVKPEGSTCQHKFSEHAKEQVECYSGGRFWTMTGAVYAGQDYIADGQAAIDAICEKWLTPEDRPQPTAEAPRQPMPSLSVNPDALHVRAAAYAQKCPQASEGERNRRTFELSGHLLSFEGDSGERLTLDQVAELVLDWNARNASPLGEEEVRKAVQSAQQNGTPRQPKRPMALRVDGTCDISALLQDLEAAEQPKKDEPSFGTIPAELCEVPGFIGDVIDFNLRTAIYPLPELALAGALSLMATITSGKVEYRQARSNAYIIGLAPSGGGKDHARKINRRILQKAGHGEIAGPERIGSAVGIVSALAEHWRQLMQIDEIGSLLAVINNPKTAPHMFQVSSVLCQCTGGAGDVWTPEAYGDRKKMKELRYPHLTIYGTSVPGSFWQHLTKASLTDGLVGRMLIFENANYVDMFEAEQLELPASLIEMATAWLEAKTHAGDLAGLTCEDGAHAYTVKATPEAEERLFGHAYAISQKRKSEDTIEAAIWSRVAEKTNKLAMLLACSRADPRERWPQIEFEDADKAVKLSNWITRRTLHKGAAWVAETPFERDLLEVSRWLERRRRVTLTELSRRFNLPARQRTEILDTLQTSERIQILQDKPDGPGRPKTLIVWA